MNFGGIPYQYFSYIAENLSPYMSKVFMPKIVKATKSELQIELPYNYLLLGNPAVPCLHGGVVATMMDHTGGFCAWASLDDPHSRVNTADLRVDYLLPVPCELTLFDAKIVHKSNKLIRVDIKCYDKVTPAPPGYDLHHDQNHGKRLVAIGRGVFNVYKTDQDLNKVIAKAIKTKQVPTQQTVPSNP